MFKKTSKKTFCILIVLLLINVFFSKSVYADNDIGSFSDVMTQSYDKNNSITEKDVKKIREYLNEKFSYDGDLYTSGIIVKIDIKLEDEDNIGFYENNTNYQTKLQNINLTGIKRTKEDYGFSKDDKPGKELTNVTVNLGIIDKSSGGGYHYYTLSILAINQDAENAQKGEKITTQEEVEKKEEIQKTDIEEFILVENTTTFGYQNTIEKDQKIEIEKKLKEGYDYTGGYKEIMKIPTKITYDGEKVIIGSGEYRYEKTNVSEEDLEKYGRQSGETSTTWDVVLIAKAVHNVIIEGTKQKEQVRVTAIYPKGDPNLDKIEEGEEVETGKTKEDKIVDVWNGFIDFAKSMEHNPTGTITYLACELFLVLPGDLFQTAANFFQTGFVKGDTLKETIRPKFLPVFKYDYLKNNPGYNDYTNVSKEEPKGGYNNSTTKKTKIIPKKGYGFTEDTKIPVAIVDIEALARNKITIVDANFFVEDKDGTHSAIWRKLRNSAVIIIRIVIFLSSALLLTILIINAIGLASSTITPIEKKEKINIIQNFTKSLFMLVGTIVIMAIGLYLNQMIFNVIDDSTAINYSETKELPMRIYVEEAKYSFSTTETGYYRYMASISNVDKSEEKAKFAFTYLFYAGCNLLLTLIMFVRMIAIFFLAIIGPIIVIQEAIQEIIPIVIVPISYRKWVIWFLAIASLQMVMALACAILKSKP